MSVTTPYCRTILVLIVLSCSALSAQNLFEPTGGPEGGLFWTLARSADGSGTLYAGTQSGTIWRSTDNGNSWIGSRSGITHGRVHEVTVHSNGTVFATIGGVRSTDLNFIQALYRSTDGGDNWVELTEVSSLGGLILNVLAGSGEVVFAMVDSGMFRSTDNGESWSLVTDIKGTVRSAAVRTSSGELLVVSYENGGAQLYRSTDNGESWNAIGNALPGGSIGIVGDADPLFVTAAGTVLLATSNAGVQRLSQTGEWVSSGTGLLPSTICYALTASDTGILFVGTKRGVFRSTDDGLNWVPTNSDRLRNETYDIVVTESGDLLAGTKTLLYRTSNNGEEWSLTAGGITESDVISMTAGQGMVFAGIQDGTVWRSIDGGTTWQPLPLHVPEQTYVSALAMRGDGVLFSGTGPISSGAGTGVIYRSIDNGEAWRPINVGISATTISSITFGSDQTLFAATDSGVFRSTTNGDIWTAVNTGLPTHAILSILVAADGSIIAGTNGNGAWRSTNNGETWEDANQGINGSIIRVLSLNPSTGTILAGSRRSGGYRSTDHGRTWTAPGEDLPEDADVVSIRSDANRTTLMSISSNTPSFPFDVIARSTDDGLTWAIIDTVADLVRRIEFDSLGNVFLSVVQSGVWRNTSQVTMGLHSPLQSVDIPHFSTGMSGNDLIVDYTLPYPATTSLALFNSRGEQIRTIQPEHHESGDHRTMIDSRELSEGLYICQLQVNGQILTRTFSVVR